MERTLMASFSLFVLCFTQVVMAGHSRLINGKPVEPGTYVEVVNILSDGAACTATVVGPRVIITAAHCAKDGATATFSVKGQQYSAKMFRSPIYPEKDHDVAIGVTSQEIQNVEPATIGGTATQGLGLTLLGFGCINPGGGGGNDGVLRVGETAVVGFSNFDMVSRKPSGAALCYGDSGGPAFATDGSKRKLIGINSKGNIQDTNYNTRIDIPESQDFLKTQADQQSVKICGINDDCSGGPAPTAPTCTLSASPQEFKIGSSTTVMIQVQGQATTASINGQNVSIPSGSITVQPTSVGSHSANALVNGPGGTGQCSTSFIVKPNDPVPDPPSCVLSAFPDTIKLGESLSLEIRTSGQVTSASIQGTSVPIPNGKLTVKPTSAGTFVASGQVYGPTGNATCSTSYEVTNGPGPDPSIPNFSVVPSHCGENTTSTDIKSVCIAVIKRDMAIQSLRVPQAVLINYKNGTQEVLPIITRSVEPQQPGDIQVKEHLHLYANQSVTSKNFKVLDTRPAILTKLPPNRGDVPRAIEGRCSKGRYFIVRNLKPYDISE